MINTFPKLETERLVLRQLKISDNKAIKFLRSDKVVNTYIKRQKTNTLEDANKFIAKIHKGIEEQILWHWCITIKGDPRLVGTICLWNLSEDRKTAEVGYDLHPKSQGKGIMNEALHCVLEFGFGTLNIDVIEAFTHHSNESSKNLLSKNNFQYIEGRKDEDNLDNIIFTVHKSQHSNS